MKKLINLLLCFCCIILCSGCGDFFEVYQYPKAEFTKEGNLIYEGQLYTNYDIGDDGYLLTGELYPILRCYGNYGCLSGYTSMKVSAQDLEKNIITRFMNHYVKEGFELPDKAFQCNISDILLYSRRNEESIQLSRLNYPICDIAESEGLQLEIENSTSITCYLKLVEYDYLEGILYIERYNDELYVLTSNLNSKWYKIKDEYQEIFKTAMEELNS
ncbi:MAG: hypothetical protein IJV85_04560 [Clostridia bacterium]|nr:hypothetical protein [Clostridia bacterium]